MAKQDQKESMEEAVKGFDAAHKEELAATGDKLAKANIPNGQEASEVQSQATPGFEHKGSWNPSRERVVGEQSQSQGQSTQAASEKTEAKQPEQQSTQSASVQRFRAGQLHTQAKSQEQSKQAASEKTEAKQPEQQSKESASVQRFRTGQSQTQAKSQEQSQGQSQTQSKSPEKGMSR